MNGGARVRRAPAATDIVSVPATSGNTTDYDVNLPCSNLCCAVGGELAALALLQPCHSQTAHVTVGHLWIAGEHDASSAAKREVRL
jgi:hypothetical protein